MPLLVTFADNPPSSAASADLAGLLAALAGHHRAAIECAGHLLVHPEQADRLRVQTELGHIGDGETTAL
jgi:hypothetical protein